MKLCMFAGMMSLPPGLEIYCNTVTVTVVTCLVVLFMTYWFTSGPQVVANIYRLPGRWYWLKRIAFSLLMRLRSARRRKLRAIPGSDQLGYGQGLTYEQMEKPQRLMDIEYINMSSNGDHAGKKYNGLTTGVNVFRYVV
ncbi:hypothetical protein Btru_054973 [Bulinus truncatus]|nr:hypothetical protein Btru_054973 [Bulinus truncatus]